MRFVCFESGKGGDAHCEDGGAELIWVPWFQKYFLNMLMKLFGEFLILDCNDRTSSLINIKI